MPGSCRELAGRDNARPYPLVSYVIADRFEAGGEQSRLSPAVCMGSDYVLKGDPRPAGGLASTVVRPRGGREVYVYRLGAVPLEALERAGFLVVLES